MEMPVLAKADPSRQYTLQTDASEGGLRADASERGLRAVLSRADLQGEEHPIAYASYQGGQVFDC